MLESEIFERDYTKRKTEMSAENLEASKVFDYAVESGFFREIAERVRAIPKRIVFEDKEAYENLLPRLDELAKRHGGKIRGIVDYEKWEADIVLTLPFFECANSRDLGLLADIATKTNLVTVTATEDGQVRVFIMIHYFEEMEDQDAIVEEMIQQDDKLVEMLLKQQEKEKTLCWEIRLF